ncbi:chemotaxis protein [Pectinatus cerevisiiphilus]|uniref:Two-component system chemotaxis response regulator CheV n=1 Tax=Pectinatus cerevisiiphilus TaxID=86956 RepID=A0A4R3K598_9FIRM|nr:chemotaxis protein [Pectinatus cerevisiiphilus]TCS77994.1 two-component system chemotaxis response regulator CheV [Pectinatus cerevisiiphilus]
MQKLEAEVLDSSENKKGILLESGTNEFEIVEFNIGDVYYGINVAKVREVITRVPVTAMPSAHPFIDGLFTLRGRAIPLVNLARAIKVKESEDPKNIIVTEINNYNIGFLVDSVSRIHRISWKNMEPSPEVGNETMIVGVIKMTDKIVLLLDFESIIAEINTEINHKLSTVDKVSNSVEADRRNKHIVIAEDSRMLRDLLVDTLHKSGYEFVRDFNNGKSAYEYLQTLKDANGPITDNVNMVISDIEMPQMDGHRLLKLVREDKTLGKVPVILFSSLINEEMRLKGERLGATAQISKPEIGQLIDLMDDIIFKAKNQK